MRILQLWVLPVTLILFAATCFLELYHVHHDDTSPMLASRKTSKDIHSKTAPSSSGNQMFVTVRNTTRFIFVVGLEGSGHHALSSLLRKSPTIMLLDKLNLRPLQRRLEYSFFSAGHGLMDSYCHTSYPINATEKMNTAVNAMATIKRNVERHGFHPDIVVNANGVNKMYSFPVGGRGECGRLKAPSLDLFYDACNRANVRCEHVFLHRDPVAILHSTTVKRPFNPDIHSGLHLYTTFLHVLHGYLSQYSSRTAGCLGLFENNMTDHWRVVQELGGWRNAQDEFLQVASDVYSPPTALSDEDAQSMVPRFAYGPNLRAMTTANDALLDLCHQQVKRRKEEASTL